MIDFAARDSMSVKERSEALINGAPLDRVPFDPCACGVAARVYGIDRGKFYRNPEEAFAAGIQFMKAYPWMNTCPAYGWADKGAWEFGGKIFWPDGDRFIAPFSEPLITKPSDVGSLPDPDPESAGMIPLVDRFNDLSRRHGFAACLPGGTPTTFSAAIVGKVNLLKWLIRYPEAVHRLQRKVTDFMLRVAEKTIAKFGALNCSMECATPMESNQLISPRMFVEFAKPYIREILGYYLSKGVRRATVHLCGDHTANLKHWVDIPLPPRTVFFIGQEMDLEKTGQLMGKGHILAGNLDTGTLQNGNSRQVFDEARRCLTIGKRHPGGFILMPGCELPPGIPLENIEAVAQALYEHGYY
ncbi:MAG: uroporphyrinogen decarboxylase family protein [Syntrophobacter sp.]